MSALIDDLGHGDAQARAESWRYSRNALRALEQLPFADALPAETLAQDLVAQFDLAHTRDARLVFVNGVPRAASVAGVRIEHAGDATRIAVDAGADASLHLIFVNVPAAQPTRWRRALELDIAGELRLFEQHVGASGADVLGELRSTARIVSGGALHHVTLSDLPESASLYRAQQANVGGGALLATTHALLGGRLQRFELDCELADAQARTRQRGVFALRGKQHVDVQLDVRHAARDAASDVLWRGVADQRARGILRGAITVAAGADGADAQLQTKNLLLSPHAEIDAQPVLEIYADEVKASHGATVGQLDERALFYLRSRGVPQATARNLLIAGFCREAFAAVGDAALLASLHAALDRRLPQLIEEVSRA